ncbi:pilus assembly protein [Streptomyces sp. AC563]|uniref:TadE family type IV pilus minor pilin n=2 Tax=Streptomyces buecherae TaxID=2763006 RepID=UPI00164E2092|nr:TadE family type IV pilus minor pilin [Streptomyces buecherae]MBC3988295.1 pilus assembly protein [Streptomyces buecherae]
MRSSRPPVGRSGRGPTRTARLAGACGTPPRTARCGDRGAVSAEAAVVLPTLALFTLMLIWGLMAASAHIQCVDAARAGARAAARSETPAAAMAAARSAAPRDARITMSREGELVHVRVETRAAGPGPLAITLQGEAVALAEDTITTG